MTDSPFDWREQRRGPAARTKPQVDSEASGGQNLGEQFTEARRGFGSARTSRRIVQINQIDVRAQVQLTHPELAHRKNAKTADLARSLTEKTNREIERGADKSIRQLRHRTRRVRDDDPIEQVGNRHSRSHPAHEFSKLRRSILTVRRVDRGPLASYRRKQYFHGRIASVEENFVPSLSGRSTFGCDKLRT